jgi:hypothetical protein
VRGHEEKFRVGNCNLFGWTAITKYARLGNLNDSHLFFTVLEVGKSR